MAKYIFERECRTPQSEAYNVLDGDSENEAAIGRLDLHFTASLVHATLCVAESLTQEMIQDLIEAIDEELVDVVGVSREEFIVHVYQGRDLGVYSDQEFEEDGNGAGGM